MRTKEASATRGLLVGFREHGALGWAACAGLAKAAANLMSFLTAEEFQLLLIAGDSRQQIELILDNYVLAGTPFVFREAPEHYDKFRGYLSDCLSIPEESIIVAGSARTGFSLNPEAFPRPFSEASDIDVLVVDEQLFDRIWTIVLRWHYPRRRSGLGEEGSWMRSRRKDIYWGGMMPAAIRFTGLSFPEVLAPLRDISTTWFNAFRSLGTFEEFTLHRVSGLLYRTWEHARMYQRYGLRQIRESVSGTN